MLAFSAVAELLVGTASFNQCGGMNSGNLKYIQCYSKYMFSVGSKQTVMAMVLNDYVTSDDPRGVGTCDLVKFMYRFYRLVQ